MQYRELSAPLPAGTRGGAETAISARRPKAAWKHAEAELGGGRYPDGGGSLSRGSLPQGNDRVPHRELDCQTRPNELV
jgi:hypothetical protein